TKVAQMCALIDEVAAQYDIYIACIAHVGDGNLHPLIVIPHDEEEAMDRSREALEQIVDHAIDLGGTVTGEHGVGLLKMRGLAKEVGPVVLDMHRSIKNALDPANIFNPGKVF
ncbi:MAG: hypothetical protein MJK04_04195, partial [Psychrosphaera sp.]|nr:hypothetical protein [Psychrosphaera sp.]